MANKIQPGSTTYVTEHNAIVDELNAVPLTESDVNTFADNRIAADTDLTRNSDNLKNLGDKEVARARLGVEFKATSTDSETISTGSHSMTIEADLYLPDGFAVHIAENASPLTRYMTGTVTSYNEATGAAVFDIADTLGSGTYSAWTLSAGNADAGSTSVLEVISSSTVGLTPIHVFANIIDVYGNLDLSVLYTKIHEANDILFAFNSNTNGNLYTSTDGVTWTLRSLPISEVWCYVTYSSTSGRYLVSSNSSSDNVIYSTDLISWTSVSTGAGAGVVRALLSNGTVVARIAESVADYAWSSDGGATWSTVKTGNPFLSATYRQNAYYESGAGKFIICNTGDVTTSTDGETWIAEGYGGITGTVTKIQYNHFDGSYIAYTSSREYWTSTDLRNWTLVGSEPFKAASTTNNSDMIQLYDGVWIYIRQTTESTYNPSAEGWTFTSTDFSEWVARSESNGPQAEGNVDINPDPFFSNSAIELGWRAIQRVDGASAPAEIVGTAKLSITAKGLYL